MMKPNRVKWKVRLMRSNYKATEGQMIPRVHLYGSLSMNEVIDRIVQDGANTLARETMVHAVSAFFREVEDLIVEGYAVRTPIGNFTPGVTGTWNFERILPDFIKGPAPTLLEVVTDPVRDAQACKELNASLL